MTGKKLEMRFDMFWRKLKNEAELNSNGDPLKEREYVVHVLRSLLEFHYFNGCKISTLIDFYIEGQY